MRTHAEIKLASTAERSNVQQEVSVAIQSRKYVQTRLVLVETVATTAVEVSCNQVIAFKCHKKVTSIKQEVNSLLKWREILVHRHKTAQPSALRFPGSKRRPHPSPAFSQRSLAA